MEPHSTPLNAEHEARVYPIAKQIMLGRWALIEPWVYVYFVLCLLALLVSLRPQPNLIKSKNEKQSFHAH